MVVITKPPKPTRELTIEEKLKDAKEDRDMFRDKLLEVKEDRDELKQENFEYAQENCYTEKANSDLTDRNQELEERLKRGQFSKKILPYTCFATAALITLGTYIILTETPIKKHINNWLDSYNEYRMNDLNSN